MTTGFAYVIVWFYLYGCGSLAMNIYETIDVNMKCRKLKRTLHDIRLIEECIKYYEAEAEPKKKKSIWDRLRGH